MKHLRELALAAAVIVAAVLLGGCYWGNPNGAKVALITDQHDQIGPFVAQYGDTYQVTWRETVLADNPAWSPLLNDPLPTDGALILDLGTADAAAHNAGWVEQYDALVSMTDELPCVILIRVPEVGDAETVAIAQAMNVWLDEVDGRTSYFYGDIWHIAATRADVEPMIDERCHMLPS